LTIQHISIGSFLSALVNLQVPIAHWQLQPSALDMMDRPIQIYDYPF